MAAARMAAMARRQDGMRMVWRAAAGGLLAVVALLIGGTLWWWVAARRRSLPCLSWLAWSLENPITEAVVGGPRILAGLVLAPGLRALDAGCGPGRLTIPAAEPVGPAGELILDPHYQGRGTVEWLARAAGLPPGRGEGGPLASTLQLVKPHAAGPRAAGGPGRDWGTA